eukprot:11149464-Alexandrium_andersonii.AAC.1
MDVQLLRFARLLYTVVFAPGAPECNKSEPRLAEAIKAWVDATTVENVLQVRPIYVLALLQEFMSFAKQLGQAPGLPLSISRPIILAIDPLHPCTTSVQPSIPQPLRVFAWSH